MSANDAILEERAEKIAATVRREMKAVAWQPVFVAVYCNGCGSEAVADTVEQLKPLVAHWRLAPELGGDDYCPNCLG